MGPKLASGGEHSLPNDTPHTRLKSYPYHWGTIHIRGPIYLTHQLSIIQN